MTLPRPATRARQDQRAALLGSGAFVESDEVVAEIDRHILQARLSRLIRVHHTGHHGIAWQAGMGLRAVL